MTIQEVNMKKNLDQTTLAYFGKENNALAKV